MLSKIVDRFIEGLSPANMAKLARLTPPSVMRRMAEKHFRQTVRWAAERSPFYKRAFAERGLNPAKIRVPADLGDFYTTPDDIVAHAEEFVCAPPSIVFESSGTTGRNKRVYYSNAELHRIGLTTAAGLAMLGITAEDRIANAFDFNIWIPGMVAHYGLMATGAFSLAFGKVDPIEVYRRIEQYKFTVVLGEPTWLIRLTELAEKHGAMPLRFLVGSAEEMPPDAVRWMEEIWKPARVVMSYGSVEIGGAIGFQPCLQIDGYHMDNIDYLTEIIEPDAEGYGEIVFTTLGRRVMPLIHYRTRDIARFITEPCACGSKLPCMSKIRGRRDELVVASGGNLYPLMFQNILEPLPELTHDWQVVFKLEGVREIMEIHVETTNGATAEALDGHLRKEITDQYPDLMKNLALGIFQMRLFVHRPGQLRVSRKLKRLVDLRYSNGDRAALAPALAVES